jgi:hypothetical protein
MTFIKFIVIGLVASGLLSANAATFEDVRKKYQNCTTFSSDGGVTSGKKGEKQAFGTYEFRYEKDGKIFLKLKSDNKFKVLYTKDGKYYFHNPEGAINKPLKGDEISSCLVEQFGDGFEILYKFLAEKTNFASNMLSGAMIRFDYKDWQSSFLLEKDEIKLLIMRKSDAKKPSDIFSELAEDMNVSKDQPLKRDLFAIEFGKRNFNSKIEEKDFLFIPSLPSPAP